MDIIIDLPILYETEEFRVAKDLGLTDNFRGRKYITRYVTFYTIDVVLDNTDYEDGFAGIMTGGVELVCPMSREEVNDKISSYFDPEP